MKFLIVNHIHYLFPTFAMQPMKFNGAASTDESITPRYHFKIPYKVILFSYVNKFFVFVCLKTRIVLYIHLLKPYSDIMQQNCSILFYDDVKCN